MKNKLLLFCTLSLFSSCSPRIITTIIKKERPLSNSAIVIVYDKKDTLPYNEKIGVTRVNDNVSSAEFNYNSVVEIAKLEASKAGGNAIRVIKHQLPNLINNGHEINADILKIDTSVIKHTVNLKPQVPHVTIPYPRLRLAINGGYSFSLGKDVSMSDTRIQTYNNELRNGLNVGGEINYFFVNGQMGVGINYENVSSQNHLTGTTYLNSGQVFTTSNLRDNLRIQYVGPMYTAISRQLKNNRIKDALIINVGMGNLSYRDAKIVDLKNYQLKGSTLGTYYSIGYDRFVTKNMALGIQLSLIAGLMGHYNISDGSTTTTIQLAKDNYQSLTHISLTIGLRFNTSK